MHNSAYFYVTFYINNFLIGGDFIDINCPISQKAFLTLNEGAEYFNIGINKLRDLTDEDEYESCILFVGNKRLLKRAILEEKLCQKYSI